MIRNTIAVISGLAVAVALILLAITANKNWFEELSVVEMEPMSGVLIYWKSVVKQAPTGFFVALLFSYGVGSMVGGIVTALIVKRAKQAYAMLIGFILFALAITDILWVEGHPTWYNICIFFVFFPFSWLGGKIVDIWETKD